MLAAHWQDYWANGGRGDIAIGAQTQRKFLAAHWRAIFSVRPQRSNSAIVDVAAGDGAALSIAKQCLDEDGRRARLLALDAAPAAIAAALKNIPGAIGAAADAASLPLADDSAALVVSQFGLEYAGLASFAEAARVLDKDGAFSAICHFQGGMIDSECAENARLLSLMRDYELMPTARAAFADFYAKSLACGEREERFRVAAQEFIGVLLVAPESAAKRFLTRIMNDLAHMNARRRAYEPQQILEWFDQTESMLALYLQRMESMRTAALSTDDVGQIAEMFAAAGYRAFDARPVSFVENGATAAWRIEAEAVKGPAWQADAATRSVSMLSI